MELLCRVMIIILCLFGISSCIDRNMKSNPVSCIGLEDGLHYIRPITFINHEVDQNTLPSILVRCYNEWIILDYNLDPNIKNYFSSFMNITLEFGSMNVGLEHINWPNWLHMNNVEFTISEDCHKCDNYKPNMAYYMTGNYYGCSFATKAKCDMDPSTLQCNKCMLNGLGRFDDDNTQYPGLCTHIILNIKDESINNEDTTQKECVTSSWNYLPSIGLNGQYCPCIKPMDDYYATMQKKAQPLYMIKNKYINLNEQNIDCNSRVIELTNDNFKYGTYRIKKCGTYTLMEDIILNMNAPFIEDNIYYSPNYADAINGTYYWYPRKVQMADINQYPSSNFIGPYCMGFFAGIAVEADDVTIDLNGFTMKMSKEFFIQQRFFMLIELGSKPFLSGQGPANFGSVNVHFASNIVIKNGILGLNSHHCIHGNNNQNVHIHDIQMIDFEIAGIAINGFDGVIIENVDIGPNYQKIPIMPRYSHGRLLLERLELIGDKEDKFVLIDNQKVWTMDIIDTLRDEMDEAFRFSYNIDDISGQDEIFHNLFVNNDGLPHGATLYGMFLNSQGASVFGLGLSPGNSYNAVLRNINIKQLRANPMEMVRARTKGPFNDLMDITGVMEIDEDTNEPHYAGNSYSNAQYAFSHLIDKTEWTLLGHTTVNEKVDKWIWNKKSKWKSNFGCNSDLMIHLTKGIFGLRIDNVINITIDGYINIEKLHNIGEFGEMTKCGAYFSAKNGGHRNQQYPAQIGYTGNQIHGITFIGSIGRLSKNARIYINDLISARGDVFGIRFYEKNDIQIANGVDIVVNNIHSGAYLNNNDIMRLKLMQNGTVPNTIPRTCVVDVWIKDNNVRFEEGINIESKCVSQFEQCSFRYSEIDSDYNAENEILNRDYVDYLKINNHVCEYMGMDGDESENVLLRMSKISDFHFKTLKLLEKQDRVTNDVVMENEMNSGCGRCLILYSIQCVNVLLALIYGSCCI